MTMNQLSPKFKTSASCLPFIELNGNTHFILEVRSPFNEHWTATRILVNCESVNHRHEDNLSISNMDEIRPKLCKPLK